VLNAEYCQKGYSLLDRSNQELLRSALFNKVNARCETCPLGIDVSQADFSIRMFAETLLANCEQVGRMVHNVSGTSPGAVSGYEDLGRMTMANYHAGPGCLANAMSKAWKKLKLLTRGTVSAEFPSGCESGKAYAEAIADEP
jgi:hypothetical protein